MRLLITLLLTLFTSLVHAKAYTSQQDSSILAYNKAVMMLHEPYDSPPQEMNRLDEIEELLTEYHESGLSPENSMRRLLSTAISLRAEIIYSHEAFPTDAKSYELLDSLCLRMVELAEDEDKPQQIQNAAIHFYNAGNLALQSAGFDDLEEVNIFSPKAEIKTAWKCFNLSDMYAEMYEAFTGEKSIVPKMEWSPY